MRPQPAPSRKFSEPPAVVPIAESGGTGQPAAEHGAGARLDKAQNRLRLAIENFEASLLKRDRNQNNATAMEQELQVLFEDRSRLTHELDLAMAQVARLKSVGAEVSHRLESVMNSIRTVLTKS